MPVISLKKPYRIGRSHTGLGLFATKRIKKGTKIIRYFGPLLDSKKKKDDAIENKYLFELNNRWTIDGSVRENIARYINHSCKPNAESDVRPRKRKIFIRAIKHIEPGDEINYDYGTDYFKAYLKPIGCKCAACEKKRRKKRAEARAERLRLKARQEKKVERKARKEAEKAARRANKASEKAKAKNGGSVELRPDRKRELDAKSRAPSLSLKTGSRPLKRKATNGVHRNGNATLPARVAASDMTAAGPEVANLAIPAAAFDETQQAQA